MKIKISLLILCFSRLLFSAARNVQPPMEELNRVVSSWTPEGWASFEDGLVAADQQHQAQQRAHDVQTAGILVPEMFGLRSFYQSIYSGVRSFSESLTSGTKSLTSRIFHVGAKPLLIGFGTASLLSAKGEPLFYPLVAAGFVVGVVVEGRNLKKMQALEEVAYRKTLLDAWCQNHGVALAGALNTNERLDQLGANVDQVARGQRQTHQMVAAGGAALAEQVGAIDQRVSQLTDVQERTLAFLRAQEADRQRALGERASSRGALSATATPPPATLLLGIAGRSDRAAVTLPDGTTVSL